MMTVQSLQDLPLPLDLFLNKVATYSIYNLNGKGCNILFRFNLNILFSTSKMLNQIIVTGD